MQQQQAGDDGQYRVTEQVDRITHFLTITLDHDLQFGNILGRGFPLLKAIQTKNDRQYAEYKIKTDIRHRDILPQGRNKQYHRNEKFHSRAAISKHRIMRLKTAIYVSTGLVA